MNEATFVHAVRARRIDALARRAAGQEGAARQLLETRLQVLRAAGAEPGADGRPAAARAPTPLGGLLDHIAQRTATPRAGLPGPRRTEAPPELQAVRQHRSTWSRLSVEQRVRQALAQVPPQAGPLNTQRLVHEALRTLHAVSPDYLHRLVAQVETLLWLEQAASRGAKPRRPA